MRAERISFAATEQGHALHHEFSGLWEHTHPESNCENVSEVSPVEREGALLSPDPLTRIEEPAILTVGVETHTYARHDFETTLEGQERVRQSLKEDTLPIVGIDVDLVRQLETGYRG